MRPGLPGRPRIGVSVRPPLPRLRPPPKPPLNPRASAVLEPRLAAAIVAAVARAKVRVSLRDMVVLRGFELGWFSSNAHGSEQPGKGSDPDEKICAAPSAMQAVSVAPHRLEA